MRRRGWGFDYDPRQGWQWGAFDPGSFMGLGGWWRGRRKWFEAGDMKYVILKLLGDKPMHGYEVMKALEEQTHGCYKPSPGTVYPTLQWLEDEGLVKSDLAEGKKVYTITDAGRAFLEQHKGTVDDIFDRVTEAIDQFVQEPVPEVLRAASRVWGQAYRAAVRVRSDAEKRRVISEILDRAAKELEAL